MGIVERLREYRAYCPNTDRDDHPICEEAADLIERLRGYAVHEPLCPCGSDYPLPDERCNCGLSALIKEIEGDN